MNKEKEFQSLFASLPKKEQERLKKFCPEHCIEWGNCGCKKPNFN